MYQDKPDLQDRHVAEADLKALKSVIDIQEQYGLRPYIVGIAADRRSAACGAGTC